jgi:hypothetical protein
MYADDPGLVHVLETPACPGAPRHNWPLDVAELWAKYHRPPQDSTPCMFATPVWYACVAATPLLALAANR